ncbi:MAG TPA: cyclic nucleotide-binding domain-containing protein, partial [Chthoniobacterales bacterium]
MSVSNSRDFFTFCTSLERRELKAVGELSEVQHIGGGETICSAGDESDTLYIISRGMAEVLRENANGTGARSYLSRGDIFGDLELLLALPRTCTMRSCEGVSLRVFKRGDLDELTRRVPTFFRYLSEQLAARLLQARDLATTGSHCRELIGSLMHFDVVAIYQTITHSLQTGTLAIRDDDGEPIGSFWFEKGEPRSARFQHLHGEEALIQLLLNNDICGTFSFDSSAAKSAPVDLQSLSGNAGELLIRAVQMRDEFTELRAAEGVYRQATSQLLLDEISPELAPVVRKIWNLSLTQPISVDALY